MRSRILLGTVFGAIGGFLGFLLQERLVPHDPVLLPTLSDLLKLGAFIGLMLGIAIGAVEGAAVNSPRLILRGTLLGATIGTVGGIFGIYFGSIVFNFALFGKDPNHLANQGNILDFTHMVLARALGWTFLGAFPGLAAGAATLSVKRARHGLVGGLLGGFIGGFVFDLVATLIAQPIQGVAAAGTGQQVIEIGGPSRAIGFTVIGMLTGLFIGLVEELLKQAWVRVLAGRNEGKDYIISKTLTVLGRDERADIPLFGDPTLAPQHAAIRIENGRHLIMDGGHPLGVIVNGQRIQQPQLLRDGDMIQLGQVRLLFREKATASRIARPAADVNKPAQKAGSLAMPSHLCPFCGAPKDAAGNCLCSVPAGAPPASPAGYDSGTGVGAYATPSAPYGAQPAPYGAPGYGGAPGMQVGTRLVGMEGPYAGQIFELNLPNVTIGREPGRDLSLTSDSTVSRRHAHIAMEGGQHIVYDDGSSNGTFVNGVRVTIQTLAPGDTVAFGASKFRYE